MNGVLGLEDELKVPPVTESVTRNRRCNSHWDFEPLSVIPGSSYLTGPMNTRVGLGWIVLELEGQALTMPQELVHELTAVPSVVA